MERKKLSGRARRTGGLCAKNAVVERQVECELPRREINVKIRAAAASTIHGRMTPEPVSAIITLPQPHYNPFCLFYDAYLLERALRHRVWIA